MAKIKPSCRIIVCNNRIIRDPGKSFGQISAQNLNREARENCKIGTKRPLESHTNMNSEVAKRFRMAEEAEQVEENLQDYKSMKSGLRRWARKGRIPVEDAYDLPVEYQGNRCLMVKCPKNVAHLVSILELPNHLKRCDDEGADDGRFLCQSSHHHLKTTRNLC